LIHLGRIRIQIYSDPVRLRSRIRIRMDRKTMTRIRKKAVRIHNTSFENECRSGCGSRLEFVQCLINTKMRFFYFNFLNLSLSFGVPGSGSVFQIRIWIQGPQKCGSRTETLFISLFRILKKYFILDQDKFVSEPN